MTKDDELQQQVAKAELIVKNHLSKTALNRYGNIRAADPNKALKIVGIIGSLISEGKVEGQIDDEQFKALLTRMTSREITIRRI